MSKNNRRTEITIGEAVGRVIVVMAVIALLVAFIPRSGSTHYEFSKGKPWYDSPIMAKETFPLLKSDSLLNAERKEAQRNFKPIFELNPDVEKEQISSFKKEYEESLNAVAPENYKRFITEKLTEMYTDGIISAEDYANIKKYGNLAVTISVKNNGRTQPFSNIHTQKTAYEQIMQDADSMELQRSILQQCNISRYLKANLTYDQQRSESLYENIERAISKYKGQVQAGQEIVHRGQIVDEATYLALHSMEVFYKNVEKKSHAEKLSQTAGHALYVTIIVVSLFIFFTQFRPGYIEKRNALFFILFITLIFPLITYALARRGIHTNISLVVPYCIVPIFVGVFMDSRTAFMTHLCCVLLCAIAVPFPFEFIVIQIVAGLSAIYGLKQLTQRSELFYTVIIVLMASLVCYLCFDLINLSFFSTEGFDRVPYYLILANAFLLLISYLLLFPFEKMFRFTSNVTLVELSNTNNEVLRRLSEEAPGTFQHSMQVANLAAEVANKIGGNSQLVRTGALYHDIGKLSNPAYFTENQSGYNPHDDLTHVHSAGIIIDHVKDGLGLAEKHKLPAVIRDFITTHHGTSKTKYFFISFKNEHPDTEVDEKLFTYPGPNPTTLEQAILMMADAVEATSRSLKEYTEKDVDDLVDRIVDAQVSEGYFNECPITFQDISEAKKVFKEKLKTIYHTRISYPELKNK